eukprot:TRINITY_DN58974_c0_g1_i1.p1 TRINITY_DN58974_c0_g1~~TRINITY_DN58974_c0_g1_i1.p1  ORF type:complete len:643 (-),score=65.86 TRINITY_DN58974_c0_g1_i1:1408-3336(-)
MNRNWKENVRRPSSSVSSSDISSMGKKPVKDATVFKAVYGDMKAFGEGNGGEALKRNRAAENFYRIAAQQGGKVQAPRKPKTDAFGQTVQTSRPATVVCYLCGQQFSGRSLPIHQPQCFAKKLVEWERTDPSLRGRKPRHPSEANKLPAELLDSSGPYNPTQREQMFEQFNADQYAEFDSGLVACDNCGRTFLPDRLQVHLRSCKGPGRGSKPVRRNTSPSRAPSVGRGGSGERSTSRNAVRARSISPAPQRNARSTSPTPRSVSRQQQPAVSASTSYDDRPLPRHQPTTTQQSDEAFDTYANPYYQNEDDDDEPLIESEAEDCEEIAQSHPTPTPQTGPPQKYTVHYNEGHMTTSHPSSSFNGQPPMHDDEPTEYSVPTYHRATDTTTTHHAPTRRQPPNTQPSALRRRKSTGDNMSGSGGGPVSAKPKITNPVNNNLVECPKCRRTFNPRSAEKHIPNCHAKPVNRKQSTAPPVRPSQLRPMTGAGGNNPATKTRNNQQQPYEAFSSSSSSHQQAPLSARSAGGGTMRGGGSPYGYQPSVYHSPGPGVSPRERRSPQPNNWTEEDMQVVDVDEEDFMPAPKPAPALVVEPPTPTQQHLAPPGGPPPALQATPRLPKFCGECGFQFPTSTCKFCQECGCRR